MKRFSLPLFVGTCLVFHLLPGVGRTSAETWPQTRNLIASNSLRDDSAGISTSVSGGIVVVGAPENDYLDDGAGMVYVYEQGPGGWQETMLSGPDTAWRDHLGSSVHVSGVYVLAGAYGNNDDGTDSGSAYLFYKLGDEWRLSIKFTAFDADTGDLYGEKVWNDGMDSIISARGDENYRGAAYLNQYVEELGWFRRKLTASDGVASDNFGQSVGISGTIAIVGAHFDDDKGTNSGAAYIYEPGAPTYVETKLVPDDGTDWDYFGYSVAVSGTTAVVGAMNCDDYGSNSGAVYVFEKDGDSWNQTAKLYALDASAWLYFGESVAIDGDRIIVGATGDDTRGYRTGAAYIFERGSSTWTQVEKLMAGTPEEEDYFGISVDIEDGRAVVGAYLDDNILDPPSPGDANGDGKTDGADLAAWQQNYDPVGGGGSYTYQEGDWDGNGKIDGADLALWQQNYNPVGMHDAGSVYLFEQFIPPVELGTQAVPEPGTMVLLGTGLLAAVGGIRRRRE